MSHLTSAKYLGIALALCGCGSGTAPPLVIGATGATPGTATGGLPGQGGGLADGGTGATAAGGTNSGGSTTTGTGGSLASDCGTTTGRGNITDPDGITRVARNGLEYIVQNNVWASSTASQKLWAEGTSFLVTQQTGDNSGAAAPVSYPSVFIGSNNNRTSANSGLPRSVNSLGAINTRLSHNADASIPGIFNASYDVWFSTTSGGDSGAPSGGYLMVWLWDPPQKNPIGGAAARWPGVTINGVSGTWDVWAPASPGQGQGNVISYVRTQTIKSLTFDLNAFIRDAVSRGYLQNTWYLSNVFGGFEIWSGGTGLNLQCFYVEIARCAQAAQWPGVHSVDLGPLGAPAIKPGPKP